MWFIFQVSNKNMHLFSDFFNTCLMYEKYETLTVSLSYNSIKESSQLMHSFKVLNGNFKKLREVEWFLISVELSEMNECAIKVSCWKYFMWRIPLKFLPN